jgi:hypothetical protein
LAGRVSLTIATPQGEHMKPLVVSDGLHMSSSMGCAIQMHYDLEMADYLILPSQCGIWSTCAPAREVSDVDRVLPDAVLWGVGLRAGGAVPPSLALWPASDLGHRWHLAEACGFSTTTHNHWYNQLALFTTAFPK